MGHNKILAPASIITIAALFISLPDKAFAANECGPTAATVTCSGDSYASGITYNATTLTELILDNPSMVIGPIGLHVFSAFNSTTVNATNFAEITTAGNTIAGIHLRVLSSTEDAIINIGNDPITTQGTSAHGAHADITEVGATGTAHITMDGGTVSVSGDGANGFHTQSANGLSRVTLNSGSVTASGLNGLGIFSIAHTMFVASIGTARIDVNGGTVTGGSGQGAALKTAGPTTIVTIDENARINAGASGIAIRDGDVDFNGVDTSGESGNGNLTLTSAGVINGNIIMGRGHDSATVTGTLNGWVYGDDVGGGAAGNDSFTLDGGTWNNARFFGNNGTDTLTLQNGALADMGASSTIDANTMTIDATSVLRGSGGGSGVFNLSTAHIVNTGLVSLADDAAGDYLLAGSWQAGSGIIELDVASPTDTDRHLVAGNMTGTTTLRINGMGSGGPFSGSSNTDGISVVQVGGNSTADAFQLENGRAVVGPYIYRLAAFDPLSSDAGELDPAMPAGDFWDYRLQTDGSVAEQISAYQSFAGGAIQQSWSLIDSLHKRAGEVRHTGPHHISPAAGEEAPYLGALGLRGFEDGLPEALLEKGFYVRASGLRSEIDDAGIEQDIWFIQAGQDWLFDNIDGQGGSLRAGPAVGYSRSFINADTGAEIEIAGPSLAATATYEMADGLYIDGIVQGTLHNADVSTDISGDIADVDGWGVAVSAEVGKPFAVAKGLILEPQMQIAWQHVKFDSFTDADGIELDLASGDSLRGRLGFMLEKTLTYGPEEAPRVWAPHLTVSLLHEFLEGDSINAGSVDFESAMGGTSLEFGGGVHAEISKNWEIFLNASYGLGLSDEAADSLAGTVRLKFTW